MAGVVLLLNRRDKKIFLFFCYASRQTYVKVNDTYSEGGTHEEMLHPQRKAKVYEQETRGPSHNQTDCGFVRLTL